MSLSPLPVIAPTSGLEGPSVPEGHVFVTELFTGIQGEGPHVGVRQIFVRFGGCDLRCWWCDTPRSLVRRDPGKIELAAGSRDFEIVENPLTIEASRLLISRLSPKDHHSVSFTGGEPLLQPSALIELAGFVRDQGCLVFLETHGGRVEELEQVIEYVDIVSMDIKLKSSTGEDMPLERHEQFLKVGLQRDIYAKIVVTVDTDEAEIYEATRMVAGVSSSIPLILQPVTPMGRIKDTPSSQQMLDLQADCISLHSDVRVIPQVHALMGQM